MAIDLLNIKPHKVSRDLSGYITYVYGQPKTGKTTLASQMPNALLLAWERGYCALPGVMAQDVTNWGEMRQIYRALKDPEVQQKYKCIVVDTVDIAADACQKYICNQNNIETLGDLGYGKGWSFFKKEFEEVFRGLTQLGYAVFFISHEKQADIENESTKEKYHEIRPSLSASARGVIENMADIYGYAYKLWNEDGTCSVKLMLRSGDPHISCGCRFKYIEPEINFTYKDLENAINTAIDKEAQMTNNQFVTTERETMAAPVAYDYDAIMTDFSTAVNTLVSKDPTYYTPKITSIVEKYLGKGKKVSDATPDQAEILNLIVIDIKEDLVNKM